MLSFLLLYQKVVPPLYISLFCGFFLFVLALHFDVLMFKMRLHRRKLLNEISDVDNTLDKTWG
jgi:hypothetical protein